VGFRLLSCRNCVPGSPNMYFKCCRIRHLTSHRENTDSGRSAKSSLHVIPSSSPWSIRSSSHSHRRKFRCQRVSGYLCARTRTILYCSDGGASSTLGGADARDTPLNQNQPHFVEFFHRNKDVSRHDHLLRITGLSVIGKTATGSRRIRIVIRCDGAARRSIRGRIDPFADLLTIRSFYAQCRPIKLSNSRPRILQNRTRRDTPWKPNTRILARRINLIDSRTSMFQSSSGPRFL